MALLPTTRFTTAFKPLTQITPTTFRDGYTFLDLYENLRKFLEDVLTPELDSKLAFIYEQTQMEVDRLTLEMNESVGAWEALFDLFMDNVAAELEALNDQAVANLANSPVSKLRIALDALYATKDGVDAVASRATTLENLVNTGRLSTTTLTARENALLATVASAYVSKNVVVVNIEDHGAKADGSDSTASIQNAVNSVPGATVFFPPKAYRVNGVVELPDNVTLLGYGATLYKDGAPEQTSYAVFCTRSNGNRGYGSGGSNIVARGLHFKGDFSKGVGVCAFALHHTDGFTATENIFEEMLDTGHILDLAGCQNINIYNNQFIGATDVNSRAEAIQIDISAVGALSVLDTAGSHDALVSRNVNIRDNFFLPLVKGSTFYPAPVPVGSHAQWAGKYSSNIRFVDNVVDSPRMHVSSWPAGIVHFSMTKNITINGNKFIGRGMEDARIISVVMAESGVVEGADPNTPQANITYAEPINSHGVEICGNTFTGFLGVAASSDLIYVDGVEGVNINGNIADNCASFIDLRSAKSANVSNNIYRNAPKTIGASVMSFNRVRGFVGTGNHIDATNVTAPANLVVFSNNSYWGFFSLNVVQGMEEAGISQAEGSTINTELNNTTQPAG